MADVTRELFVPGARTPGQPRSAQRPIVPLEWLMCHPATYPWWGKAIRTNIGAPFIEDTAILFDPGFEGVVTFMKLIGHSNVQGANLGIAWQLLVNKVPVFRARRQIANGYGGGSNDQASIDDLGADDGQGDTWGDIRVWVEPGGLVTVRFNNNGGNIDAMGWVLRGYGWPIDIRDEWVVRGWRK